MRITILLIVLIWLIPTIGVLITSFRPEALVDTTGWWTALAHPFRDGGVDARELSARARCGRVRERVPEQPRGHDPVHGDPHHDRGVRGLRLLVDGVPGAELPVRRRRRAAGRPDPDDADPVAPPVQRGRHDRPADRVPRPGSERDVPRHLARARGVRAAARDLPAPQLHRVAAVVDHRVGEDRRRRPLHDLLAARRAAVGARARGVRDLPVPVGVERPAGRVRVPRAERARPGCSRSPWRAWSASTARTGTC